MLRAHVLVTIMLTVFAAACVGSSHDASLPSQSPGASAATRLTVTYAISQTFRSRDGVPSTCVPRARCFTEKLVGTSPRMWERMARQTLTCSPDGGTYTDPAKACAAVMEVYRLSHKQHPACSCPVLLGIGAVAHGVYAHHRATVALDFCSVCGLGASAIHDIHVLTPHGLPG